MRETLSAADESDSQRSRNDFQESNPTPNINLRNYRRHKSTNFIKVNQIAKATEISTPEKESMEDTIKKAEKDFALDLNMLALESSIDEQINRTITALEDDRPTSIRPPFHIHSPHLNTRFRLLFYNDKIVIPEHIRNSVLAILHQGHVSITKMEDGAESFWWPGIYRDIREKVNRCTPCRLSGKNFKTQIPKTEQNKLELLSEPNLELQLDFAGPIKSRSQGNLYILVSVDRFSKWPTAMICKNTDSKTVIKFF